MQGDLAHKTAANTHRSGRFSFDHKISGPQTGYMPEHRRIADRARRPESIKRKNLECHGVGIVGNHSTTGKTPLGRAAVAEHSDAGRIGRGFQRRFLYERPSGVGRNSRNLRTDAAQIAVGKPNASPLHVPQALRQGEYLRVKAISPYLEPMNKTGVITQPDDVDAAVAESRALC